MVPLLFGLIVIAMVFVILWVAQHYLGDPGTESSQPVQEGDEQQADQKFPPPPIPPGGGGSRADCEEPAGGEVYRALRADEDPSQGFTAKNPGANYTIEGHILNGSKVGFASQFISTSWSEDIARTKFGAEGARVAKIDLSKVEGRVWNLDDPGCRESVLKGVLARNIARAHQELLIEGAVPASAITMVP